MDLPLFPLHLVLYPGRPLPLHLFEQRYRQMLRDCLDGDGRFGVVAIRAGREVGMDWRVAGDPSGDDGHLHAMIHEVGTITEIKTVAERPDGRFDIITRGAERFRVLEPLHDKPYLHAVVEPIDDPRTPEDDAVAAELRELLVPYLKGLGVPDEFCDRLPADACELSYLACSALQVEVAAQQQLLELPTPAARMAEAARIIRRESGIIKHLGLVGSFRPLGPGGAQLN
ncbi:LON peptidase substrate-binding domain-containing protein [Euzebya sp.]|uniref:LON peptidase substrate-binding domain-containing protein n=1 Tax=Euzebya sp. TaxID=1971409 RepID=UPI0035147B54